MNEIVEVKTITAGSDEAPIYVIMVAANVVDPKSLGGFVDELVEKVKLQRMISPPTTNHLLVSVRGETTADRIRALWIKRVAADPVMTVFMAQMVIADVVRAARTGPTLEQVSLLA